MWFDGRFFKIPIDVSFFDVVHCYHSTLYNVSLWFRIQRQSENGIPKLFWKYVYHRYLCAQRASYPKKRNLNIFSFKITCWKILCVHCFGHIHYKSQYQSKFRNGILLLNLECVWYLFSQCYVINSLYAWFQLTYLFFTSFHLNFRFHF